MMRRYALLIAPAVLFTLIPPLATIPARSYDLGLTGTLALCSIVLLAWLAAESEQAGPAEVWARIRRPRLDRRALAAAAGLLLVIVLFAASKPLETKANDWQVEHDGVPIDASQLFDLTRG